MTTTILATLVGATPRNTYTPGTPDWTGAACIGHDPEIWYPDPTDVLGTREAVTICHGCPLQQPCLEQAMREEPAGGRYGIRGGLTPEERRKLTNHTRERVDDYLDEVRWLLGQGETPERAAQRVGVSVAAIARAAYRRGDDDLAAPFARIQNRDRRAKTK